MKLKDYFKKKSSSKKENFESSSLEETIEIGKYIAKNYIKDHSLILLNGDLGVGKTALVKGIFSFFNVHDEILSPTFAWKKDYKSLFKTKQITLTHYDLYLRENLFSEEISIIQEDLLSGIVLVEWANNYNFNLQNKNIVNIKIDLVNINEKNENQNTIKIEIEVFK